MSGVSATRRVTACDPFSYGSSDTVCTIDSNSANTSAWRSLRRNRHDLVLKQLCQVVLRQHQMEHVLAVGLLHIFCPSVAAGVFGALRPG
jgi:hypothetical protein